MEVYGSMANPNWCCVLWYSPLLFNGGHRNRQELVGSGQQQENIPEGKLPGLAAIKVYLEESFIPVGFC